MQNEQLPDGTWVTTPIQVGSGQLRPPCPDGCNWQDVGAASDRRPRILAQRCPACGQVRGRYLDDPTKEYPDGDAT